MGNIQSTDSLIDNAIHDIRTLLNEYKTDTSDKERKKAKLLAYWLSDYVRFLRKEKKFDPKAIKRYQRGEIVKVHLGYNIGSEEGGLHYCVVLDKNNALSNPNVTIIPLTSVKPGFDIKKLHPSKVFLGDYVYFLLKEKSGAQQTRIIELLRKLKQSMDEMEYMINTYTDEQYLEIKNEYLPRLVETNNFLIELQKKKAMNVKLQQEIEKMKTGSIALVSQITTVSKIRIYDPLHSDSPLSDIRLSPQLLTSIDKKIHELFLGI